MKNIKNIIEQKYPPENPNDLWMKDNVLYKSTHKGWTPLTAGSGSSTNGVTSTTWQELKDKRDAGKLTPGALYRITDYNCTTTQENTRSAGHQFDIVLLALSEDKLAEEGWAMEHPTDVYDVTFADGVTKKCWIYKYFYKYNNSMVCNLISIENKLGAEAATFTDDKTASHDDYNLIINEENKTATYDDTSGDSTEDIMSVPNLPYNYFQNSNLSAWKVWYCLDNDKSRFAWADDASEESIVINSVTFNRYPEQDADGYYAWKHENSYVFTSTLTLKIGDMAYVSDGEGGYDEEDPIEAVSGFGRGVIYRLIDEWNNDVGYDFKNIQFIRPLTDGEYDPDNGTDTWVYTFSRLGENDEIADGTMPFLDGETYAVGSIVNKIEFMGELSYNVFFTSMFCYSDGGSLQNTIVNGTSIILYSTSRANVINDDPAIYIGNKKVLTEE